MNFCWQHHAKQRCPTRHKEVWPHTIVQAIAIAECWRELLHEVSARRVMRGPWGNRERKIPFLLSPPLPTFFFFVEGPLFGKLLLPLFPVFYRQQYTKEQKPTQGSQKETTPPTPQMKDSQGIARGSCSDPSCSCTEYQKPAQGNPCDYCGINFVSPPIDYFIFFYIVQTCDCCSHSNRSLSCAAQADLPICSTKPCSQRLCFSQAPLTQSCKFHSNQLLCSTWSCKHKELLCGGSTTWHICRC